MATERCGATKHNGEPCRHPAGYRTDHPGIGKCVHHFGRTDAHNRAAQRVMAVEAVNTYGLRRDIDPMTALLEEVQYTAGHVEWLRQQVQRLEANDLGWGETETRTASGEKFGSVTIEKAAPSIWLELYQRERKHLVQVCQAAIGCGVAERLVRQYELEGQIVAEALARALDTLELTEQQRQGAYEAAQRQLRAV